MIPKLFAKDFKVVEEFFPKLTCRLLEDFNSVIVSGQLDICDETGIYWDTFEIALIVEDKYPFSVPVVIETSKKIPREVDRHVSDDGICCLDMDHRLMWEARRGINICNFLRERVYPFFANQLYYEKENNFANREWAHQFDGVVQFYETELGMTNPHLIFEFLKALIDKRLPGRNYLCLCKERKYKYCPHKDSMEFLSLLPASRINEDLNGFKNLCAKII